MRGTSGRPGGAAPALIWHTRHEYSELVDRHLLREGSRQAEAMRRGLHTVILRSVLDISSGRTWGAACAGPHRCQWRS